MSLRHLAILPAIAVLLGASGCLVPKSKYTKLEAENARINGLLNERDSELAAAQDTFRKRMDDLSREIDLYKAQSGAKAGELTKIKQELDKAQAEAKRLQDEAAALGVGEMRDGRLVLQASLLFSLGSDTLSPQGSRALDKIAGAFKGRDVLIQIDGHTDNTPIVKAATRTAHGDNLGLSAHRALAVFRYLLSKGVAERNMYVRGFGPSWPVTSNATAASKARNRRVEILFIPATMVRRPTAK